MFWYGYGFWRLRLGIAGLVLGGMLLFAGFREWQLGAAASAQPEDLTLEQLIARGPDGNPNVRLRDFQLGDNCAYFTDDHGFCWTRVLVPAVPSTMGEQSAHVLIPKVIVKSTHVSGEDQLDELHARTQMQGLVVNRIESLGKDERELLVEDYPGIDFEHCIIFEEGRKPSDGTMIFLMGGGGLALLLGGGGLLCTIPTVHKTEDEGGGADAMKEPPQPSAPAAPIPSILHGRLCIILAALLWSTSGAFTKLLTQDTGFGLDRPAVGDRLDPLQIAFGRALFAGLSLLPLLRRGDVSFRPAMIGTAACFAAMNALYVTAMAVGSAANAVFLQYTAPMWLAVAGVFWLKEPADLRTLMAVAVSMVGVAVIVVGGWGHNDQLIAAGIAVGSGMAYAAVLVGLRVLRGSSSRWLTVFNHLIAAAALAPALLLCWRATPSWPQVVTLFLYGSLQMGLPYWLVARGLRSVSSQEAGMLTLLEPLFNPLWAFLVSPKTEGMGPATWIGGACILAALAWRYWPTAKRVELKKTGLEDGPPPRSQG